MPELFCRDELASKGIAMGSLSDWQAIHGRCSEAEAPIRLKPLPSNQKAQLNARLEERNPNFGNKEVRCGERGWLKTETLEGWFKRFGRPISSDSDVRRLAGTLLNPAPDLYGTRRLERMKASRQRQKFAERAQQALELFSREDGSEHHFAGVTPAAGAARSFVTR
eukprot:TRINITY_DN32858_c0_g1_i1.p1 TRINITY_DN32858_c0_g1~~TRINITY_DN32858_c0_g1_i1.p1  ORF type:complete len:176 (+),score=37.45 TRINITY_DN32858_c0_g1_i1:33-530(+)